MMVCCIDAVQDGKLLTDLLVVANSINFVWLGILIVLFYPKQDWPRYLKQKVTKINDFEFTELRRELGDDFLTEPLTEQDFDQSPVTKQDFDQSPLTEQDFDQSLVTKQDVTI